MFQADVNEKTLNVRLPESEFRLLARYAAEARRTKTDVVRELIRSLEQKPSKQAREAKRSARPDTRG